MTLIRWDEKERINVQEIDVQHKKLIARVNVLHEVMKSGKGGDVLGRALSELINFTKMHFATEEAYMTEYGYPECDSHRAEHEKLLRELAELEKQYYAGDALLPFAIALDLKAWALRHISTHDKEMARFLNRKGIS